MAYKQTSHFQRPSHATTILKSSFLSIIPYHMWKNRARESEPSLHFPLTWFCKVTNLQTFQFTSKTTTNQITCKVSQDKLPTVETQLQNPYKYPWNSEVHSSNNYTSNTLHFLSISFFHVLEHLGDLSQILGEVDVAVPEHRTRV
jgi:hypothetical protein